MPNRQLRSTGNTIENAQISFDVTYSSLSGSETSHTARAGEHSVEAIHDEDSVSESEVAESNVRVDNQRCEVADTKEMMR
jgi:hypothetical protein